MHRLALTALVLAIGGVQLSACGGATLKHTIPTGRLKDMSRQGQIWVYDAENEIVVALDQLDEAQDTLRDVRRQIMQGERSVEAAEKRGNAAAVEVAENWTEYLKTLEEWAEAQVEWRRLGVVVGRASFELAKAQIIQREDLLGGKNVSVDVYRKQHDRLRLAFDRRAERLKKLRQNARDREARWWTMRRRFVAQTGNHDVGLWIE